MNDDLMWVLMAVTIFILAYLLYFRLSLPDVF